MKKARRKYLTDGSRLPRDFSPFSNFSNTLVKVEAYPECKKLRI